MMGKTSGLEKTVKCTAAIATAFLIGKFGADDDTLSQAAGATDGLVGVLQHTTTTAGDDLRVMLSGISDLKLGGSVTRGGPITSDANGKGVAATLGDSVVGFAMASGVSGDIIPVLIFPGRLAPNMGADGLHFKGVARATFDATAGKSTAAHGLGVTLPDNAIVTRAWYEVITTFTSAADTATIALGVPTDGAAGIKAAVAIGDGGNPWDAGNHDGIQDGAAANFLAKLTAARELTATVAVQALTAGKLILYCEYVVSI